MKRKNAVQPGEAVKAAASTGHPVSVSDGVRAKAEILRAAELIRRAVMTKAARADCTVISRRASAMANYDVLLWCAGEETDFTDVIAAMDLIVTATDSVRAAATAEPKRSVSPRTASVQSPEI